MTPLDLARGFIAKGKEDEAAAVALVERPEISDDVIGFHLQQAAEKYLKAILAIGETRPTRTHDLSVLLAEVEALGNDIPDEVREIREWSRYAVRNRYPLAETTSLRDRSAAMALLGDLRDWVERVVAEVG